MKTKKVEKIIAKKIAEVTTLCKLVDREFAEEAIHKFRISVKSLRALLSALSVAAGEPKIKLPKSFLRLYHIAGITRQVQLELAYLKTRKVADGAFIGQLQNTMKEAKKDWQKYYAKKTLRRLKETLENYDYGKLSAQILDAFFSSSIQALDPIKQNDSLTDQQLHNARKKIKNIIYVSKIADKACAQAHKDAMHLPIDKLDKLADLLGKYNDDRMLLDDLNAYTADSKNMVNAAMKLLIIDEANKLAINKKAIVANATLIQGAK